MNSALPTEEFAFRQTLAVGDFVLTSPMPCWCKDYTDSENPVYLWISRSYEDIYNVDRKLFEGFGDEDVWPAEIAEEYLKHDLETIEAGMLQTIENAAASANQWKTIRVTKWCVKEKHFDHEFCFVYGIAGPISG